MQEANPIETRNVANNAGFGSQLVGLLNNVLTTGAGLYQSKLQSEAAIKNQSTGQGVNGTVADPRASAAAALAAGKWVLPVIIGLVALAVVALVRRR